MGLRVIIPVAGVGSRLRPHTHTAPKVMVQVAGKPMLGHILDELKNYDVDEIIMVVGHMGEAIVNYVKEAYDFNFRFITQSELKGLGHAIWLTGEHLRDEENPLLIILGDTIFAANFRSIIGSDSNWIGVKEVEDPRRFGVVELEGDRIKAMVEKPENPPTNLAIVGIYYFTDGRALFKCLDEVVESGQTTAGEIQLTDALQKMIEQGKPMKPFIIDGWYDCGKPETLLSTNRILLGKNHPILDAQAVERFKDSRIKPPVSIGKGVTIENSIVGPNVSIADGVTIRNCIVRESILSKNAVVEDIILENSILSDNAHGSGQWYSLNIGDSSDIKLG
jgi:glucose-1-phosphate thymidylyltransferase